MDSLISKEEKKDFSKKSQGLNTIEKCNICGVKTNCLINEERFNIICYTCYQKIICWLI